MLVPSDGRILVYGPRLANVDSLWVEEPDYPELERLQDYMVRLMWKFKASALSAPQVGVFNRVVVIRRDGGGVLALVNPQIGRMYGREVDTEESCLSVPPGGNISIVPRMEHVSVEYRTIDRPDEVKTSMFSGRESVLVQHQIDHLDGTFFFERARHKEHVLREFNKWKKEKIRNAKNNSRQLTADRSNPNLSGLR